jgi:DHA1 family inner membrane transport protein
LAPGARASATAGHSAFFFLGQAIGPVIYGLGLNSVGIVPVLLTGTVVLTLTGWTCAMRLRRQPAPAV